MSTNTRTLQKRAAQYLLAGRSTDWIAKTLRVRESTVLRWRTVPRFMEYLQKLMQLHAQDVEIRKLSIASEATMSIMNRFQYILETKECVEMIKTLKNIDKFTVESDQMLQNQPKSAKISRNQPEPPPNQPQPAGISVEPTEQTGL